MKIPLASSGLRSKDIMAAIDVLNSGQLTMGANVKDFENCMEKYLNVSNFVMMNSGSSANLAIFEALMRPATRNTYLQPGDGVIVPAIAWPTTIWPIIQLGLKPVFIDIDPKTLAIDLDKTRLFLKENLTNIKAIFPIHPLGKALDNLEIERLCEEYNLIYISDVCESLGSWINGKHAGTSGLASSFSFYFSHHITTMEGGGVATDNDDFADDLRSIRSHGWSRDRNDVSSWNQNFSKNDSKFLFITSGYNIRPMEIQAAIGKSQIQDIDLFVNRRIQIAEYINSQLKDSEYELIGANSLETIENKPKHSWMLLPIKANGKDAQKTKKLLLNHFEENEIETRPVLTGNFLDQPAMKRIYKESPNPRNFPGADLISNSTFLIGAHHDLTDAQIEFIGEKINEIVHA